MNYLKTQFRPWLLLGSLLCCTALFSFGCQSMPTTGGKATASDSEDPNRELWGSSSQSREIEKNLGIGQ